MNTNAAFDVDDYDEINDEYFKEIRAGGAPAADPSGWLDAYSAAVELLPEVPLEKRWLAPYYIDEDAALGTWKEDILALVSAWEGRPVASEEVTLCHSVSICTLTVMLALRQRGIRTVLFETPVYSVTVRQAASLGLSPVQIPTYRRDGYRARITPELIREHSPCAVWITQPRMSLGYDQSPEEIARIVEALSSEDILVVDEATEQRFPSLLRDLRNVGSPDRVLRMRGLLKGVGLNGLRIAFVLHSPTMRHPIQAAHEFAGGSLDVYSLAAARSLSKDIPRFRSMLAAANHQVTSLRARAERLAYGSGVEVSHLVNGYIGSAAIKLRGDGSAYSDERRRFLEFCRARQMPVILGTSMRFARDPGLLQVRLNYFNGESNIMGGITNMIEFTSGS